MICKLPRSSGYLWLLVPCICCQTLRDNLYHEMSLLHREYLGYIQSILLAKYLHALHIHNWTFINSLTHASTRTSTCAHIVLEMVSTSPLNSEVYDRLSLNDRKFLTPSFTEHEIFVLLQNVVSRHICWLFHDYGLIRWLRSVIMTENGLCLASLSDSLPQYS